MNPVLQRQTQNKELSYSCKQASETEFAESGRLFLVNSCYGILI